MALQASIPAGQTRATSILKMKNLVDYALGIGQAATCVTYGDLAAKLNLVADALALPNFDPATDNAGAIRAKINAINTGLGLDNNLDLFYDAAVGRYWSAGGPLAPSSQITDTHNDANARIQNAAGTWSALAANALSANDLGLWSYPTRTNSIRNNSNVGAVVGTPGTLPTQWAAFTTGGLNPATVAGIGTEFGLPYIDLRFYGTLAGDIGINLEALTTVAANDIVELSVYARLIAGTIPVGATYFQLAAGRWLTGGFVAGGPVANMKTLTSDMTRIVINEVIPASGVNQTRPSISLRMPAATYDFTVRLYGLQMEIGATIGAYASPPIITANATATRLGNAPKIVGLNSTTGVAGFIKVDLGSVAQNGSLLFYMSDGTLNERFLIETNGSNQLRYQAFSGNVQQGILNIAGAPITGTVTVAFAYDTDFIQARLVGGSAIAADTLAVRPACNQVVIGGNGTSGQMYQRAKKFGLKFGPQNQASFDEMYALAAAA